MELVEALLKLYQLQEAWFSDCDLVYWQCRNPQSIFFRRYLSVIAIFPAFRGAVFPLFLPRDTVNTLSDLPSFSLN